MATLLPEGKQSFTNSAGVPLVGGKLYTYDAGTSAPRATYSDAAGLIPNTNPVVLDARGEATIFWSGAYKVILKDSLDNTIWTVDQISDPNTYANAQAAAVTADVANAGSATKGAGQVGFDWALNYAASTVGWGMRTAGNLPNALRYMPVTEWANILNGTTSTDLTTYVQQAVNAGPCFFPRGKWPVSATTGITLGNGAAVHGAGRSNTIFWAILGTGGSSAQKVAYSAGSVFKRAFTPGVANTYCGNWDLRDFAIILNHPTGSVTATAEQLGLDLRNVSRFTIERVHVGNFAPISSFVTKADPPAGYAQQGYGIVVGNVASGNVAYCGGEVGTIRDCSVWGAYKAVVQDDATLSPNSAAHAVDVLECDIQLSHHLLVQESSYTTGITWANNTIQGATKRNGDASPSYVERFSGYNSRRYGGYCEAGNADYLLLLDSTSKANIFELGYYSALNAAQIVDAANGNRNVIRYKKNTGAIPGGVDSLGFPIELYDSSIPEPQWVGNWTGAAMQTDFADSATVTRNGVGDYNLVLSPAQKNALWVVTIEGDTNASGHPFVRCFVAGTQSTTTIRFFTFGQNAGVTTQLDPRKMWIRVSQSRS